MSNRRKLRPAVKPGSGHRAAGGLALRYADLMPRAAASSRVRGWQAAVAGGPGGMAQLIRLMRASQATAELRSGEAFEALCQSG